MFALHCGLEKFYERKKKKDVQLMLAVLKKQK
jgi:hypothetical protein